MACISLLYVQTPPMAEKCAFGRENASLVHAFLYKRDIGTKEPKGATPEIGHRSKPEFNVDRGSQAYIKTVSGPSGTPPCTCGPATPRGWGRFFTDRASASAFPNGAL